MAGQEEALLELVSQIEEDSEGSVTISKVSDEEFTTYGPLLQQTAFDDNKAIEASWGWDTGLKVSWRPFTQEELDWFAEYGDS